MATAPISVHYTPAGPPDHGQADIVFFETPKGGAVFSSGSITWMSSTPEKNYDNDVARIEVGVICGSTLGGHPKAAINVHLKTGH